MAEITENVQMKSDAAITPSKGSAGLSTQVSGQATTVSNAANATGGVGAGNFVEQDIDADLFAFKGDDTPLCNLCLRLKRYLLTRPKWNTT